MALGCNGGLVTLAADEFDELVGFYSAFLEQEPVVLQPSRYAEFELPGVRLGIFRPQERGGERERGSAGKVIQNPQSVRPFGLASTMSSAESSSGRKLSAYDEAKIQNSQRGMGLCLEVEDLEGAIAHLTQLGYPPTGEMITASHGHEIYAYDPEGNWLILHQGL